MKPLKVKEGIYRLGSLDWDRRIFDALIPLPDGTSYNAYLIRGSEKTVLIDTDDPDFRDEFMSQLEGVEKLDYLVSLHAEQDHSGCIPFVLEKYPGAKVLVTSKCKNMEMDLLHIPAEKFITVEDASSTVINFSAGICSRSISIFLHLEVTSTLAPGYFSNTKGIHPE